MSRLLLQGDARHLPLADKSVHMCVTSPPYWSLRDYGTARWEGGDPTCNHLGSPKRTQAGFNERYFGTPSGTDKQAELREPFGAECGKCGARRIDRQIGLEESPSAYVETMVAVFREVKRVLRDDATLWLNLGDSYNAYNGDRGEGRSTLEGRKQCGLPALPSGHGLSAPSLKQKDLVGIPWRVALALQADGWYLRAEIIWHKPNAMPSSVTDRPSTAHEYLFLLSKRPRYYYDADAIREPVAASTVERDRHTRITRGKDGPYAVVHDHETPSNPLGRNRRSVWTISSKSFKGAHFATYPPALVEPCVLAGTSERGCCPRCGKGWLREVERDFVPTQDPINGKGHGTKGLDASNGWGETPRGITVATTLGWKPGCRCDAGAPVPCTVFDPFSGASTTGLVCRDLGRRYVGLDLSREYLELAAARLAEPPHAVGRRRPAPPVRPGQRTLLDLMGE